MASLPLFKIGVILFKEMAKPIAGQIKTYAVEHAEFKRVTMMLGRGWEGFSQRVEIMFRGHKLKELKAITDAHALTVGADVVSQSFLISVAVFLVVFEFYRGNAAKVAETAIKAEEKRKRQEAKHARLVSLETSLSAAHARIAELESRVEGPHASWVSRVASSIIPGHATAEAHTAPATPVPAPQIHDVPTVEAPMTAAPSRHLVKRVKPPPTDDDDDGMTATTSLPAVVPAPSAPTSSGASWWTFGGSPAGTGGHSTPQASRDESRLQ